MKESPILSVLDKIEELREFVANPKDLDYFIEKVNRLDKVLPRLELLNELLERVKDLDSELYMFKDFWSADEAAKYLGVHKSRIYRLSSEQEIPVHKPNERVLYIKREDLTAWMEQFRVPSVREMLADADHKATLYEMKHRMKNHGR